MALQSRKSRRPASLRAHTVVPVPRGEVAPADSIAKDRHEQVEEHPAHELVLPVTHHLAIAPGVPAVLTSSSSP